MRRSVAAALLAAAAAAMTVGPAPGVVLGLNGAYQRRVAFDAPLTIGAVNRAAESSSGVGGKGQGAFLAAAACGKAPVVLAQFSGGDTGRALCEALRARVPAADERLWVETAAATRVCTTLVAAGDATEVVEPSGLVLPDEVRALDAGLRAARPAGLLAAGSLPPGVDADFYARCVSTLAPRARVLVDAVTGLEDVVAEGRANAAKVVVKVNARELLKIAGDPVDAGAADTVGDAARVARAAATLAGRLDAGASALAAILWTDGPAPAGALVGKTVYALKAPPLPGPVVSPIGAGDTVAGATFAAWLADAAAEDDLPPAVRAFRFGLARGAASCLTGGNAEFDESVAAEIEAATVVTRVDAPA